MKKVYKDRNGRIYLMKESYDEFEDIDPENEFEGKSKPDPITSIEMEPDKWEDDMVLDEFISDFDEDSRNEITTRISQLPERLGHELIAKVKRNFRRLFTHNDADDRYDILMDMIEDAKEKRETSFNYDADKVNFADLDFDTESGEFDEPAVQPKQAPKPVQTVEPLEDDAKNLVYALDQELKLAEQDRDHFYLVLKSDPDTDYEAVVLGKQGNNKYIFNIFTDDDRNIVKAISIADIDLEATLVDGDSLF